MSINQQIPEISAEMLLNLLYPELEDKWIAHHDGTFYRNYSRDVLSLSPEDAQVSLSRDSILGLLPRNLLSPEGELKGGDMEEKHDEITYRLKLLSEAFLPFDTFTFRRRLKVEHNIAELVNDQLTYFLKTYYGYDLSAEQNPYVRAFAVLLPGIRRWRGDFDLVRSLLAAVFHCEVDLQEGRYSEAESARAWLPVVRYELLIPDLDPGEFRAMQAEISPLRDFLAEWFIPLDVRLELLVKHHKAGAGINGGLTLNYNTEI